MMRRAFRARKSVRGDIVPSVLRKILIENLFFITLALMPFCGQPALAQEAEFHPVRFLEPLSLSRGKITPASDEAVTLDSAEACRLASVEWGWSGCDIEQAVFSMTPGIDTLLAMKPNSEGRVSFDDWDDADRDDQIAAIEQELREGAAQQGAALGRRVEFVGWRVYPTLDRKQQLMFFATDVRFDDEVSTNVRALQFDRRGYVAFSLVPVEDGLGAPRIEALLREALSHYVPVETESYAAFEKGDKVAAVGAVGVLATVLGVKYGKTAGLGFLAIALPLLKKFGVFVIAGIAWLGRLTMRRRK